MSRNFELLQRVTAEQAPADAGDTVITTVSRRRKPDPRGLSGEELIRLTQRLLLLTDSTAQRVVVFTGEQKGSGCSTILAGAGQALAAQMNRPVCLVDANAQNPSLHLCFGAQNVNGLTDFLAESRPLRDFVQKLPGENLWLLPCGSNPSRLATVVTAEKFPVLMAELRQEFAYVLVDSPPIDGRVDAVLMGRLADGVVMVLAANATRIDSARIAKEAFEAAQVHVLGVVLNKRTFPVPGWLYRRV